MLYISVYLQCIGRGTMPYVHKLCETWLPVAGVPFPHAFPHYKAHFPFPLTYIHYSGDFQVFLINKWALYFENITILEQKAATVLSKAGTGRYDIPEWAPLSNQKVTIIMSSPGIEPDLSYVQTSPTTAPWKVVLVIIEIQNIIRTDQHSGGRQVLIYGYSFLGPYFKK